MPIEKTNVEVLTYFGIDARLQLASQLKARNLHSAIIAVDEKLAGVDKVEETIQAVRRDGVTVARILRVNSSREPTYEYMDELAAEVRTTSAACIVGIGGGTVLDIAKGMGILMTNPGQAIQYRGMDKVEKAGVPVVLLPTTAGTGSEVTKTASFIDLKENRKLGINGRF